MSSEPNGLDDVGALEQKMEHALHALREHVGAVESRTEQVQGELIVLASVVRKNYDTTKEVRGVAYVLEGRLNRTNHMLELVCAQLGIPVPA